jgi:hypothetical protein
MSRHHSAKNQTNEWATPPHILKALGLFDLDPCAMVDRPWSTALHHYTVEDDGLSRPWWGRVFLNPPYSLELIKKFMARMADHDNGIALIFARTCTGWFHQYVFNRADSILFLEGRLHFHRPDGSRAPENGGAPSVLIAYGEGNMDALADSGLPGRHVPLNTLPMVVVTVSPSWKKVVGIALTRLNGKGSTQQVYQMVERLAPDKVRANRHYREKVRQQLQKHFTNISKGYYINLNLS